jgi:hypothetical protein
LHAAFEIPIGVEREAECGVENCQATWCQGLNCRGYQIYQIHN